MPKNAVNIGLNAVIFAVNEDTAKVLILPNDERTAERSDSLPFGPFEPEKDRTLDLGMRRWIHELTGLGVGYVEQLYTFGNRFRDFTEFKGGARVLSVSYMGLMQEKATKDLSNAEWVDIYEYLPWEDWREGRPEIIDSTIIPELEKWAIEASNHHDIKGRKAQILLAFGRDDKSFDHERVLNRLELLYAAGLVPEATRDYHVFEENRKSDPVGPAPILRNLNDRDELATLALKIAPKLMRHDHRRILASGLERARGKIKYRPVVFELLPERFTLLKLQRVVEALSGVRLHKQNFRRLLLNEKLVEETDDIEQIGRGRPAALFQYREQAMFERSAAGVGLPKKK